MLGLARHNSRSALYSPLLTVRLVHDPSGSTGLRSSPRSFATASTRANEGLAHAPLLARSLDQSQTATAKADRKANKPGLKKKEKQPSSHRATQSLAKSTAPQATKYSKAKDREQRTETNVRVVESISKSSPKAPERTAGSAGVKYSSTQAPWQVLREAFAQEMAEQASALQPQPARKTKVNVPARRSMLKTPAKKSNTTDRGAGKAASSPVTVTQVTQDRRPVVEETEHNTLRLPSRASKGPPSAITPPVMKGRSIETRALEIIVDNGRSPASSAPPGKFTNNARYPNVPVSKQSAAKSAANKFTRPPERDGKPLRRTIPRLRSQRGIDADSLEDNLEAYSYATPVGGWSIPCFQNTGRLLPPAFYSAPSAKPALAVTSHVDEADDLLQCIPLGTPLGLDAEWKVDFRSGVISKTALLQICSPNLIVIIQCRRMKSLPRRLVELLQDPHTIKTGVAVVGDCRRLQRDFQVTAQGILELGSVAKSVDAERWRTSNGLIGLSTLCRVYLDRRLVKDSVRTSDWEGPLSKQQIEYAASDAFVALEILGKLCSFTARTGGEQASAKAVAGQSPDVVHHEDDRAISAFMGPEHVGASAVAQKKRPAGGGLSKDDAIDLVDSSSDEGPAIAEEVFLEKSKRSDWFVRPHYAQPQKPAKPSRRLQKNIYSHLVHLSADTPATNAPVSK